MVKIKYTHTKEFFFIEAIGHTNYAENGKDIVCASISTLVDVLYIASFQSEKDGEITNLKMELGYGYFKMNYVYIKDCGMRKVVNTVIDMLEYLKPEYGEYFKVCEVNEDE